MRFMAVASLEVRRFLAFGKFTDHVVVLLFDHGVGFAGIGVGRQLVSAVPNGEMDMTELRCPALLVARSVDGVLGNAVNRESTVGEEVRKGGPGACRNTAKG